MALSRNAQFALFLAASNLSGVGKSLKKLDKNNTGSDDLAGKLLDAFSPVLLAIADDDISSLISALELNVTISQQLIADLKAEE